jgi:hypothetical protein
MVISSAPSLAGVSAEEELNKDEEEDGVCMTVKVE